MTVPSFRRGVKFRFDTVRDCWIILAPEKLFMPDEIAVEILQLVDGARSIDTIIDDLAARFDAPRDEIATDVIAALEDLSSRGVIQLTDAE
ncbi:pyrroloquinoline quinone biosynthesis peptide chaperone PqqD [Sphingobium sp. CR28]|uniref:pyrroloquinoline quinone biosynthesis peptide chaperone PqqD n=1 Tax=Sphingobium sp. CR28 TaxID=3400272 RepID=UPI003FEED2B1